MNKAGQPPPAKRLRVLNKLLARYATLPIDNKGNVLESSSASERRTLKWIWSVVKPIVLRKANYSPGSRLDSTIQEFTASFFSRLKNKRRKEGRKPLVVENISFLYMWVRGQFDEREERRQKEGRPRVEPGIGGAEPGPETLAVDDHRTSDETAARAEQRRILGKAKMDAIKEGWADAQRKEPANRLLYCAVLLFVPYRDPESAFCDDFGMSNGTKNLYKGKWIERVVDAFVQTQRGVIKPAKLLELYRETAGFRRFGELMALPGCSYLIAQVTDPKLRSVFAQKRPKLPVPARLRADSEVGCMVLDAIWQMLGTGEIKEFPQNLGFELVCVKFPPPAGYVCQRNAANPIGYVLVCKQGAEHGTR